MANAEERERRALAKDLHDDLGQLLAVIGLKISMLQKQNMTETLHDGVQDCAKAVQIASQKMREITLQLNPPMLDQLGFIPAMHWLADEMHRMHQLEVVIHDDGLPQPMLPAVSSTLFRTLRELLHKIAQHAQVKEVEITTERGLHNTFIVTVEDVGDEFDLARIEAVQQGHISDLLSVRERLGYLGGEMSLLKDASGGTAVVLKVPLLSPFEITDAKEQSQT